MEWMMVDADGLLDGYGRWETLKDVLLEYTFSSLNAVIGF